MDYAQLQADRRTISLAARWLRDRAIQDHYAGLKRKDLAFAAALVLDELARHVRDLDADLRRRVIAACRSLLDGRETPGPGAAWRAARTAPGSRLPARRAPRVRAQRCAPKLRARTPRTSSRDADTGWPSSRSRSRGQQGV